MIIDIISPSSGDLIAKVPLSNGNDLDAAITCAERAFPAWSNLTIKQRAAIMFKFHYLGIKYY